MTDKTTRREFLKAGAAGTALAILPAPHVIAFAAARPEPVDVTLCRIDVNGVTVSSLTRFWAEGDTRRCRLCPRCTANHARSTCSILVTVPVAATVEEAGLFDARELRWG